MNIAENLQMLREEIASSCAQAGRKVSEVQLVAVSKTKPWTMILEAANAGHFDFGENYMQEALEKIAAAADWAKADEARMLITGKIHWHYIGHLQSNKAKFIPGIFSLVHSLDRLSLAEALNREAEKKGVRIAALLQINSDAEDSKAGIAAENALEFLEKCNEFTSLEIRGLMCIPNPDLQKQEPRRAFAELRELREKINSAQVYRSPLQDLSMGMSGDFREAILEGATIVRVGSAIFGARAGHA